MRSCNQRTRRLLQFPLRMIAQAYDDATSSKRQDSARSHPSRATNTRKNCSQAPHELPGFQDPGRKVASQGGPQRYPQVPTPSRHQCLPEKWALMWLRFESQSKGDSCGVAISAEASMSAGSTSKPYGRRVPSTQRASKTCLSSRRMGTAWATLLRDLRAIARNARTRSSAKLLP